MCARRFLIAIFVLTLLAVAAAFALFQFGQEVLVTTATPSGQFEATEAGSGPDYADHVNWIARPDVSPSPAEWRPSFPDGTPAPPPILRPRQAATFYIHPTTYLERDSWNGPLDHEDSRQRAELFVRSQASAFNALADIWAPRYRQAAYGAFLLDNRDARQALDLAYGDVARAFDAFIEEIGPQRPIILAAHSQGALHLARLLRDKIAGTPLARRIVAAYVVGWPLSTAADLPAMGLPACAQPDQANCILGWQSFRDPANVSLITAVYDGSKGPTGIVRRRQDMLCVNPLNGTMDGSAPPGANPGTLVPDGDLTNASLEPGRVGATCRQGFLYIDGNIPELGPYVLPGNNYHVYDFALFWGAVRRDAERRLQAWRR
jgi:hypothetical protein